MNAKSARSIIRKPGLKNRCLIRAGTFPPRARTEPRTVAVAVRRSNARRTPPRNAGRGRYFRKADRALFMGELCPAEPRAGAAHTTRAEHTRELVRERSASARLREPTSESARFATRTSRTRKVRASTRDPPLAGPHYCPRFAGISRARRGGRGGRASTRRGVPRARHRARAEFSTAAAASEVAAARRFAPRLRGGEHAVPFRAHRLDSATADGTAERRAERPRAALARARLDRPAHSRSRPRASLSLPISPLYPRTRPADVPQPPRATVPVIIRRPRKQSL